MAIVKLRSWQLILIKLIVLPVLRKLGDQLEKKAVETPQEWDDVIAGAFKTVVEFLNSSEAFEET